MSFAYARAGGKNEAPAAVNLRLAVGQLSQRSYSNNAPLLSGGAQFTEHAGRMRYSIRAIRFDRLLPRTGNCRLDLTVDQVTVFILFIVLDRYAERARWLAPYSATTNLRFDLGLLNRTYQLNFSQGGFTFRARSMNLPCGLRLKHLLTFSASLSQYRSYSACSRTWEKMSGFSNLLSSARLTSPPAWKS